MHDAPWKQQFPQVYQKVRQIPLARQIAPAQWMLLSFENGLIQSDDYLPWAQNYYGLGSLKSSFFEPRIFSPATYHKYKNHSTAWGPQALPICEWENVLFVACLDPHSVPSIIENQPMLICRPLLARYEDLVKAWIHCLESSSLHRQIPATPIIEPPPITPINPSSSLDSPHPPVMDNEQSIADSSPLSNPPPLQQQEPPSLSIRGHHQGHQLSPFSQADQTTQTIQTIDPEVSSAALSTPHLSESAVHLPNESQAPSASDTVLITEIDSQPKIILDTDDRSLRIIDTSKKPAPKSKTKSETDQKEVVEKKEMPVQVPPYELKLNPPMPTEDLFELMNAADNGLRSPRETFSPANLSHDNHELHSDDKHASLEIPEGLHFESNQPPKLEALSTTGENAKVIAPPTPPVVQQPPTTMTTKPSAIVESKKPDAIISQPSSTPMPVMPSSSTSDISSSFELNPPPTTTLQTEQLEEELTLGFTKAYQFYRNLMVLKLKDNIAIPMRWDPSYKKSKSLAGFSLDQPSIFRIAAKTKKPFHGPIAPNPINNQFIEHWFDGHTPNYLTIYPLFFEKKCVGLLLGASDEPLDRKDSLNLMESTAEIIEINFGANLAA